MANIGKRYADAIYEKEKYSDSLKTLCELYKTDEFKSFISNPKITNEEKSEVIKSIIKCDDLFFNFIKLLLKEKRMNIIPDIYDEYMKMLNKDNGVLEITITTSNEITNDEAQKIADNFKKKYKALEVKYKKEIDKSIIGGVKVTADGKIYDNSIKTKLNDILN